jgi:dCMP deaminase
MNTLNQIIDMIKIQNLENKRLNWDEYFMSISFLISSRSPCKRLQVGSVIVKENRILSAGYNGFLPGAPHISRIRENHEMSTVHAEMNAIADCAKRGVDIKNGKVYITHFPCINCFKAVVASGITEIIYHQDYNNDSLVIEIAKENNILLRKL